MAKSLLQQETICRHEIHQLTLCKGYARDREQCKPMIDFDSCQPGKLWAGQTFKLEQDDIIAFAKHWDPQPFHTDPELAKTSHYGGITAPSAYLFALSSKLFNSIDSFAGIGAIKHEIEIRNPARAGDTLTFSLTCLDKRASISKPDRGLVRFRLTLTTQHDELVYSQLSTLMLYRHNNVGSLDHGK